MRWFVSRDGCIVVLGISKSFLIWWGLWSVCIQRLPNVLTATQWAEVASRCIGCKAVFRSSVGVDLNAVWTMLDVCLMIMSMIKGHGLCRFRLSAAGSTSPMGTSRACGVISDTCWRCSTQGSTGFAGSCFIIVRDVVDCNRPADRYNMLSTWLLLRVPSSGDVNIRDMAERSDVKKRAFIHTTTCPLIARC